MGTEKRLRLAEVITLTILRFHLRIHDLQAFHRLVRTVYQDYFPGLSPYENLLKATNLSFPGILVFLNYRFFLTRRGSSRREVC
jgi:hypothetical protein